MKMLMIIFCLLPLMLINAQIVDRNSFNEKIMNDVMFNRLNENTKTKGGYSISLTSEDHRKIYMFIKRNGEKLKLDDLSSEINGIIQVSSVGILGSLSIKNIKTYHEIAEKYIADLINSPSDAFFMIGWGKTMDVTSLYNNRTGVLYISLVFNTNF